MATASCPILVSPPGNCRLPCAPPRRRCLKPTDPGFQTVSNVTDVYDRIVLRNRLKARDLRLSRSLKKNFGGVLTAGHDRMRAAPGRAFGIGQIATGTGEVPPLSGTCRERRGCRAREPHWVERRQRLPLTARAVTLTLEPELTVTGSRNGSPEAPTVHGQPGGQQEDDTGKGDHTS